MGSSVEIELAKNKVFANTGVDERTFLVCYFQFR